MAQTSPHEEESSSDDLTARSIEWVIDVVSQWIESNETAQALQRNLPDNLQRQLWALPLGHHGLAGAMAMSMNPQTIREAHEWLVSARAQILSVGSLSHPPFILSDKRGDENGAEATVGERDVERRVEAVEVQVARMEAKLARVIDLLDVREDRLEDAR